MATEVVKLAINASDKTKAAFRSVEQGLKGLAGRVFSLQSALAATVGAAGLGALVTQSLKSADALAKTSDKLGIATERLAGLRHAAELSGVAAGTLDMALQRMVRRVAEAAQGSGEAVGALQELGISAKELATLAPDEQFRRVADAMAGVGTQGDRVRLAMKLFDSEGVALVNTLALQRDGLDAAQREAEEFGTAISRVDAAKIEAANDALFRAQQAVKGTANTIAVNLAPYLEALATAFADAARESGGFKEEILTAFEFGAKSAAFFADVVRGLQVAWKGLEVVFKGTVAAILTGLDEITTKGLETISPLVKLYNFFADDPITLQWQSLTDAADIARQMAVDAVAELQALALEPMPSEGVEQFLARVREASEKAAQAVAAAKRGQTPEQAEAAGAVAGPDALDMELDQAIRDEEMLVIQEHNARIEQEYLRHQAALGDLQAQGALERLEFEKKTMNAQASHVLGTLANLTAGVAQHSKGMFQINKAAGIANALVSTYAGVTKALAAYPPPLSFGMAAAQLAAGMAQVNAIRSTSFSGGGQGTSPSLAGSAPTVNDVPVGVASNTSTQQAGNTFNISLESGTYSDSQVRTLIERIGEVSKDMGGGVEFNVTVVS